MSAWNSADYIEEAIQSIVSQKTSFPFTYEILLAIDGCPETLDRVNSFKHKYEHLKVFHSDVNVGWTVHCNSLIYRAKYDYIIRFDSDDIMMPNLIQSIYPYAKENDLVRYKYRNFGTSQAGKILMAHGTVCMKKSVFDVLGGFVSERMGMDSEFLMRAEKCKKLRIFKLNKVLFKRRKHNTNLTVLFPTKDRDRWWKNKEYLTFYVEPTIIDYENKLQRS